MVQSRVAQSVLFPRAADEGNTPSVTSEHRAVLYAEQTEKEEQLRIRMGVKAEQTLMLFPPRLALLLLQEMSHGVYLLDARTQARV